MSTARTPARQLYEAAAAYQSKLTSRDFPSWEELDSSVRRQWERASLAGDKPIQADGNR